MTFDIKAHHPTYDAFRDSWRLMRDAIAGEDEVKTRGTDYLPMKSGTAAIPGETERANAYNAYKLRAEFPEIVAPTITGQRGLITSQPPTIDVPVQLEPLLERATSDGLTLEDLFARIVSELLSVGRYGLFPTFDAASNPYIATYTAETIINWDTTDGALSYVVLDETTIERSLATNRWDQVEQFRELMMEDGRFTSRLWRNAGTGLVVADEVAPTTSTTAGQAVDFLPFVILGTRDLSIDPDDVPLYGLAKVAVRMYRMDADYQQALHMTSEPTPYVTGFENPQEDVNSGRAPNTIGAASLWVLPPGASAGFLEFSGAGLSAQRSALDASKESASSFGARMFDETNRAPESGSSRQMRYAHTTASLKTISKVAASGLERALRYHARWLSIDPDTVSVTPNLDWVTDQMTPQELDSLVKSWQAGVVSYETVFERLQAGKVIAAERTIEDETQAILDDPLRDAGMTISDGSPEAGLIPPPPQNEPATPGT